MPTSPPPRSIPRSPTTTSAASTNRPTLARDRPHRLNVARNRPGLGAVLVCLALVLAACGSGDSDRPAPTPTNAGSSGSNAPAPRDLYDLARRFRGAGDLPRQVALLPPAVGDQQTFDIVVFSPNDNVPPERRSVTATLRATSEHAYLYVESDSDVDGTEVQDATRVFEDEVWPAVTSAFGPPPDPGVDGDPHIVLLHAGLGSVGGYVNDEDSYTRALIPHSNQRETLYLNSNVPLGSRVYAHVVAHEFQHLVHERNDPVEEVWLNEGLSEYAGNLLSRSGSFYRALLDEPDTQLNDWTDSGDPSPHYGASSLFVSYLLEQTGSEAGALASLPSDGLASVHDLLRDTGALRTLEELVGDWAAANLLDLPEGPYSHRDAELGEPATARVEGPGAFDGEVHQFAADYLELRAEDFSAPPVLTFEGDPTVFLLNAQNGPPGNNLWWAGRGDDIDSTLTRELDLGSVRTATLTFRTWFDIERWFDHGYVTVSADGGQTWEVLSGAQATQDDPLDVTYGPSYSGTSGGGERPAWVDERIDLSRYAGQRILLRFEYVTDGGFTRPGWAIDDIAVPEIGFSDDAQADAGGWRRAGFRRLSNPVGQRFSLRLITFGDAPAVQDIPLDGNNRAEVRLNGLGAEYNRAVVAVVGLTGGTTEPAGYRYTVGPAAGP